MNSEDILKIHDIALANVLEPDFAAYYRSICRWYSEKFSTPLHVVHTLPPHFVLLNFYEANLSNVEEEDLDQLIFKALNPDTDYDDEEDIQDFIKMVEDEESKGIKPKKKSKQKKSSNKTQSLKGDKLGGTSGSQVVKTYDEELPPDEIDPEGLEDLDSLASKALKPTEDGE